MKFSVNFLIILANYFDDNDRIYYAFIDDQDESLV